MTSEHDTGEPAVQTAGEDASPSLHARTRLQFMRSLAGLAYQDQLELLRPAPLTPSPVQRKQSSDPEKKEPGEDSADRILAGATPIVSPPVKASPPKGPSAPPAEDDTQRDAPYDAAPLADWLGGLIDTYIAGIEKEGDGTKKPAPGPDVQQRRSPVQMKESEPRAPDTVNTDQELSLLKKSGKVKPEQLEQYRTYMLEIEALLGKSKRGPHAGSKTVEDALNIYYRIDLDGFKVSLSYFTNRKDKEMGPRQAPHRRGPAKGVLKGDQKGAYGGLRAGTPRIEQGRSALKKLWSVVKSDKDGKLLWGKLSGKKRKNEKKPYYKDKLTDKQRFDRNYRRLRTGDKDRDHRMLLMAYLQTVGLGTDCVAFVQNMLIATGHLPKTDKKKGIEALAKNDLAPVEKTRSVETKKINKKTPKRRGKNLVRPCDNAGVALVRSGDVIITEKRGHIMFITRVGTKMEGNKPQIILELAHSTPGQKMYVKGRKDPIGLRPEGVRVDLIAWTHDPATYPTAGGRWSVIRSAFSEGELNGGKFVGFYRAKKRG